MKTSNRKYHALISSDWNGCLAPSGPFDFITFTYPSLESNIREIFKAYTGNRIPLSEATQRIADLLPRMITEDQMDSYLDSSFATYPGVPELIEWCDKRNILFLINTTGMQGYFQRVFRKGLLPKVPVISANPMIKFGEQGTDVQLYDLLEIQDKPKNTRAVMDVMGLPSNKVVLLGDSGGDGPHFEWGARAGAYLIGSMTKESLSKYCRMKDIKIDFQFGPSNAEGQVTDPEKEMQTNFMDLRPLIERVLDM